MVLGPEGHIEIFEDIFVCLTYRGLVTSPGYSPGNNDKYPRIHKKFPPRKNYLTGLQYAPFMKGVLFFH